MENTIENAMAFTQTCDLFTEKGISSWYDVMVAYAASVSPNLVLPERMKISRGDSSHVVAIVKAWNGCYDEFIRLNPSILK